MAEWIIEVKDGKFPIGKWTELVRCKDCKYFELDSFANINGVKLIVGHEICNRWGEGCKTSPEGYCFMGERKVNQRYDC